MNLNKGKNEYSRNMTKIVLFLPEKRAGTKKVKWTVSISAWSRARGTDLMSLHFKK